jgi:hypothetical protein
MWKLDKKPKFKLAFDYSNCGTWEQMIVRASFTSHRCISHLGVHPFLIALSKNSISMQTI